jgi:hypothetical protein
LELRIVQVDRKWLFAGLDGWAMQERVVEIHNKIYVGIEIY